MFRPSNRTQSFSEDRDTSIPYLDSTNRKIMKNVKVQHIIVGLVYITYTRGAMTVASRIAKDKHRFRSKLPHV